MSLIVVSILKAKNMLLTTIQHELLESVHQLLANSIDNPGSGENGGNIMAMKKKTSFMLSARDKRLLELLAKKEARSQTKELEYLIRRRAEELKIEEP